MNIHQGQLDEHLKKAEHGRRSSLDDQTMKTAKRNKRQHHRHHNSGKGNRDHSSSGEGYSHSQHRAEEKSLDERTFPNSSMSMTDRDKKIRATTFPHQDPWAKNTNVVRQEGRSLGVKGVVVTEEISSRGQDACTLPVGNRAANSNTQGRHNDGCARGITNSSTQSHQQLDGRVHGATSSSSPGHHNGEHVPGSTNSNSQGRHMDERVPGAVVVPGLDEDNSRRSRDDSRANSTNAITARVVDPKEEHRVLREQVQEVLREERAHEHAAVVYTAATDEDLERGNTVGNDSDGDVDSPKRCGFLHGTRGRLLILALILVIVAAVVAVTLVLVLGDEPPDSNQLESEPTTFPPTPSEPTPSEPTPTQATPSEATPSEPTPTQPTPIDPTLSEVTPSEPTPRQPTPTDPTPSEATPSEPTPTQPTPTDPTPSEATPSEPTPIQPTPTDPTPTPEDEYPPIPLAYCNNTAEPRVVYSELDKRVCGGNLFEYPLNPNPADVVDVDVLLHSPEAAGFNVDANLVDTTLNEIVGVIGSTYDRDPLQVEANSQQGVCGVPAILEIVGEYNCGLYDLTVEFYERVNFNMAGTGFDDALVIALDDGITPYSSCGSINDVINCDTAHYWTLQANEGDEIYVNSLVESENGLAYWTFYDGFQAELDSASDNPVSGRKNVKAKFIVPTTGTHYIRLHHEFGAIDFYAVAFQVKRSR